MSARAWNRWRRVAPGQYDRLHHFISSSVWGAGPLKAELARQADCMDVILSVDDTALVSLTLAREEVSVAVGLRLFLTQSWTCDPTRMDRAGVPRAHRHPRTKPGIALAGIDRQMPAKVCRPASANPSSRPKSHHRRPQPEAAA